MLTNLKKEFINLIIENDVLKFGEFETKSKRKSPYFINIGNFKTGKQLNALGKFYAKMIEELNCQFDAIIGPAYKGIPLAIACCNALYIEYGVNKPFLFNRKETKDHGEKGMLVGHQPSQNEKIIIVEDVLTAGTAIKELIPALTKEYGVVCKEMFVAVNRCEFGSDKTESAANELKRKFNINVHSIITIKDIRDYISQCKICDKQQLKQLDQYIKNYCVL